MKNSLKGFVEGTYNVTTGDKMKSGDHRRSKFRCKFFQSDMCLYSSSRCMGSAHCDNYNDGVEVYVREESFDYKLLPSVKLLKQTILELIYKIPVSTLEGEVAKGYFYKKHSLSPEMLKRARKEKEEYLKYLHNIEVLEKEIEEHNEKLFRNCMMIGLCIVTIPFCYFYYKKQKRNYNKEIESFPKVLLDEELQKKVIAFELDIEKWFKESADNIKPSTEDKWYQEVESAKIYFRENDYSNMAFHIQKAIKHNNTYAMRWLAEKCEKDMIFLSKEGISEILLLYASYLGDAKASELLSIIK